MREPASSRSKPCVSLKNAPGILPVRCYLCALIGRKQTVVTNRFFPQKPPDPRHCFSRTGVRHSPGSSTIELPSALAESGAYPPNRALPGSPRRCLLPLACHRLPKSAKLELGRDAHLGNTINRHRVSTVRLNRESRQLAASLEDEPALHPPERLFHSIFHNSI